MADAPAEGFVARYPAYSGMKVMGLRVCFCFEEIRTAVQNGLAASKLAPCGNSTWICIVVGIRKLGPVIEVLPLASFVLLGCAGSMWETARSGDGAAALSAQPGGR